ncbi:hypothetical protein CSUI_008618, partial [Cystoisospora suis]
LRTARAGRAALLLPVCTPRAVPTVARVLAGRHKGDQQQEAEGGDTITEGDFWKRTPVGWARGLRPRERTLVECLVAELGRRLPRRRPRVLRQIPSGRHCDGWIAPQAQIQLVHDSTRGPSLCRRVYTW